MRRPHAGAGDANDAAAAHSDAASGFLGSGEGCGRGLADMHRFLILASTRFFLM